MARQDALDQWPKMSAAMIDEEELLNYAQAALLLNVSVKRINELVRQETLEPFEFFGRRMFLFAKFGKGIGKVLRRGFHR